MADNLNQFRDDDGKLIYVGLGAYNHIYVCPSGDTLCADCAQEAIDADDPDAPVDAFSEADTDERHQCAACGAVLAPGADEDEDDDIRDGMEYEVQFGGWHELDGPRGTVLYSAFYLSEEEAKDDYPDWTHYRLIEGWGARWSMPGCLDCTEWTVYDTEAEALAAEHE